MRKSNRTVALGLDNCTAHSNVTPKTVAKIQPTDTGVIRCLKLHHLKALAKMRLLVFEQKNFQDPSFSRNEASQQCLEFSLHSNNKNCLKKLTLPILKTT